MCSSITILYFIILLWLNCLRKEVTRLPIPQESVSSKKLVVIKLKIHKAFSNPSLNPEPPNSSCHNRKSHFPTPQFPSTMGFIRSTFSFLSGTVAGVYVAQNYNVPNIGKLAEMIILIGRRVEETYRKPKKRDSDDGEI